MHMKKHREWVKSYTGYALSHTLVLTIPPSVRTLALECDRQGDRSICVWCVQEVIGGALAEAKPELLRDLSVHVCFICLLHLANENSLRISGFPMLDRLTASNVALTSS